MIFFLLSKFLLGLVVGSFVAALTYRYPKKISNIRGRSFCDNCKEQIVWYDNIPLLSYVFLRGRCRNCKKKISWRYPLIELVSGIGFIMIGFKIVPLILFCLLMTIFIIDLENKIIPDIFVFIGIFFSFFIINNSLIAHLLAGFLSATFLFLIFLFTKGRGMGLGDVKFSVLGGMIVGLPLSPIWLFVAFLTGAIVGIILILSRVAKLKSKIAFGPFLILAIPITLFFGNEILKFIGFS